MDRSREARRVNMAASNGLSRRRHRSNSLRDSPEDDVVMETQETVRLRDRKKERDQHRERERERDRMSSRSSKRRRGGERLIHTNREDGVVGDDSSEESVNDDEDEDDEDSSIPASMRMLPPNHHHLHHHNNNNNNSSLSSSSLNNHHHSNNNNNISSSNHHHQRKSFPPPAKVFRAAAGSITTAVSAPWKAPDEMIGVSVPRKARSASTKRSHEWASSGGVTEPIHRQASTSPVRSSGGGGAVMGSVSAASPAAPVSPPSSSNISVKKKMKSNGPKQRPPKSLSSSKPVSSSQDEIEIEIAEVLYGLMRQPQASNKQEIVGGDSMKVDSREMSVKATGDAKSRVSSPISNLPSTALPQSSSVPPTNSSSSTTPSMSAIAPKRKRPRPVKYEDENPSSALPVRNRTVENDQSAKVELNLDKNQGSAVENGTIGFDLLANQAVTSSTEAQTEPVKQENNPVSDAKPSTQASESRDLGVSNKEEPRSPSKESNPGVRPEESLTVSKSNAKTSEVETHREEKFQIDLMAPPPLRSSPERDSEIDIGSVDPKPTVTDVETELKPVVKEDDKAVKIAKDDINVEPEEKKAKVVPEEADSHKPVGNKERNIDLQLDLEKTDRESGSVSLSGNKPHVHVQNQKPHQQPSSEKNAQPNSLPLPMSMASWPGGLPPMGYMAPLQGVVSMDGTTVPSPAIQPPHLLFNQPRPKRCATHCYIARNILYHQQFTRMNPYWPAAPGSALQFGTKPFNVNVVPSPELLPGRGANSVQDKGQSLAIFPHTGKDKSSQPANIVDTAQRKQILLQQALPPGAPNNILHAPAFIFPLGQQPGAAGASVRPGTIKSPLAAGTASSSSTSSSASVSATAAAVSGAAMSFNYPNMPGNETQYLAILQNGAYPIPIPAHVGANPAYRGAHPPAMPFFNGSFYSSQMLHPSALPQQQPPPTQSSQSQQGHQNPSISSGSSSSQKHLQNQQPRPHTSSVNGSGGNLQAFPGQKNLPSQSMQLQSRQQNLNHMPLQTRQLESEVGGEESPSTADSRVSRANMSIYGQNFGMPMHPPPNFTLMTPTSVTAANTTNNTGDKKQQQQQPQSHGSKAGTESFQSQPFAMSFAFNGAAATPGLDISSIAPNYPLLPSIPEAARHGYLMAAAATVGQTAQQKKNFRASEEGKVGGNDGSNAEEERKAMAGGKASVASGQSIAFSRSDLTDASGSAMPGNVVIDTSAQPMNLGSNSVRAAGSVMSAAVSTVGATGVQQQIPRNQQQLQLFNLQKQHQYAAAAAASARSKPSATSNGTVFPDQISTSSSMAGKFPSTLSAFPQNLVQSSSSPAQSPQWKGSARTAAPQVSSPTLASTSSSLKNLPQQQIRTQQGHTQISFAANPKPSAVAQGQPPPSSNQSASPPMVVGSPTTSSISKSAGGSPRTTSTSTSNKGAQTSSLSSQQAKNSPAVANQKSSPVGGRNIRSILGHPQSSISTSGSATKPQLTQQQHLQKQAAYQQMFYMQAATASSANNASAASGFYLQRHRGEPPQQQSQGSSTPSSTGMLSLGPSASLANTGTTDPAKAVAAAVGANNMKGGSLPSNYAHFAAAQSSGKGHQLVPGFSFVHPVPSPVQVKPAEQKQPAGE